MKHLTHPSLLGAWQRWLPVLDKYGVTLPLECPLHAARDVFAQQEAAKIHVPPQWTCGLCGKAFYHEAHLDRHLDNRHEDYLNNVSVRIPHLTSPNLTFHTSYQWHGMMKCCTYIHINIRKTINIVLNQETV